MAGISSLEDTVRETGRSEVMVLRSQVVTILDASRSLMTSVARFMHSDAVHGDELQWNEALRRSWSATVSTNNLLYFISVVLHPYPPFENPFYSTVWGDLTRDGTRNMLCGHAGQQRNNSIVYNQTTWLPDKVMVGSYNLNTTSGGEGDYLYEWDASSGFTGWAAPENFDPRLGKLPPFYEKPFPGAIGGSLFPPQKYPAIDGYIQSYTMFSATYFPPPAPHPWSGYRAIVMNVGFLFAEFRPIFEAFGAEHKGKGAAVMMVARSSNAVLATTSGLDMIPEWCQAQEGENAFTMYLEDCYLRPNEVSKAMTEAYEESLKLVLGGFYRLKLDGEDHFVQRLSVEEDWELIWVLPVSSVNAQVQEALSLLFVFTAIVLVFDILVAVCEMFFIARPIASLAESVRCLRSYETDAAQDALAQYKNASIMILEMRRIVEGMFLTIDSLKEYGMFIPNVLIQEDSDAETEASHTVPEASTHASSQRSSKRSSGTRTSQSSEVFKAMKTKAKLGLHLAPKRIALLSVSIKGWSKTGDSTTVIVTNHTALLSFISGCAAQNSGHVENFCGDDYLVGFNTNKQVSDCGDKSVSCALAIRTDKEYLALAGAVSQTNISCGCTTGKALVGNLGNDTIRRFSLMTPLVKWADYLAAYNDLMGRMVTADHSITGTGRFGFVYETYDLLLRTGKSPTLVSNVLQQQRVEAAEWMYEMEEAEQGNALGSQNDFVTAVLSQKWDKCEMPNGFADKQGFDHIISAHKDREFHPVNVGAVHRSNGAAVVLSDKP